MKAKGIENEGKTREVITVREKARDNKIKDIINNVEETDQKRKCPHIHLHNFFAFNFCVRFWIS